MKKQMATVDCPKTMVGRVIGKNGETIRALQNYTGALIQIDQTVNPMKVSISGTLQSLNLAISMVTDIVNGTFKGFAMLRQIANEQTAVDSTLCQPVYAAGYGLIPPSQLFTGISDANVATAVSPTIRAVNSLDAVPPIVNHSLINSQEEKCPSSYILGLSDTLKNLSLDTCSNLQTSCTTVETIPTLTSIDTLLSGQNISKIQASSALPLNTNTVVSESQLLQHLLNNTAMPSFSLADTNNFTVANDNYKMPLNLTTQTVSQNNIRVLCDPNGRLFYLDESTGQVGWVDDSLKTPSLSLSTAMLSTN